MFEAADTPEEKLFNLQLGKSTGKVIWTYIGHHTEYNRVHMKDHPCAVGIATRWKEELSSTRRGKRCRAWACVYWGLQRFFYETEPPTAIESGRRGRIFLLSRRNTSELSCARSEPTLRWASW